MSDDRIDQSPIRSRPRPQNPIEAPRVAMPADTVTGWQACNRNGVLPFQGAGLPAVHRRLPDDAAVTVPPGVVIQVCPSADDLCAAREAARPAPLAGERLGLYGDWLVKRTRKPGRKAAKASR